MIEQIQWLGHGSFVIQGPPLIYINPWRLGRTAFVADAILIGHDHYEHFSQVDIERLRGPQTIVLANETVAEQVEGASVIRPYHSVTIDRARITAIPAYSVGGDLRHAPSDGGLGFVISLNFYDIYYAGDTHETPEMMRLQPDIAILPIDGNDTLTVEQAADVVRRMRPRYVIPMNWGADGISTSATTRDALRFKQLVAGRVEVILPSDIQEGSE